MKQDTNFKMKQNNDLVNEKYRKTSKYLNHVEHLLTLVSTNISQS